MTALTYDQLLQDAFEYAAIGMAIVDLNGRWLKGNRSVCDLLGYQEAELLTLTFQDITHPDDLDLDLTRVSQTLTGEISSYQIEKRYIHKDGHVIWGLLSVSLARNEKRVPLFFISQIQDITARKRAEAINESLFQLPVALHFVAGFDGFFKRLSPSWSELLGHSIEHLTSVPFLDLVHPEDRQRTIEEASKVAEGGSSFLFENRYRHADGTYRWVLWASRPNHEESLIYGVALDYTARKAMELDLAAALEEKDRILTALNRSTRKVQELRQGLLTICAWTKRVRHEGRWMSADEFLSKHLEFNLTHGIAEDLNEEFLIDPH